MRNIKMIIGYDGTNYHGFQCQKNVVTIQGTLQKAFELLFKHQVKINAASRTDAGVHALGQVITLKTSCTIPIERISIASKKILPADIYIVKAEEVTKEFKARRMCKKTYLYKIIDNCIYNPLERNFYWHIEKELNIIAMNKAVKYLIGKHNFSSFCSARTIIKNFIREIYSAYWVRKNNKLYFEIVGNGFLYNMIRIIVGTCVNIGKGKQFPEEMKEILQACNRTKAGFTAPPQGLYLMDIKY